ncbi:MAG TPA: hypothetical protein VH765_10735 [Xanthobacteraceae bacterium]|jgi:hypothetical protein
MNSRHVVCLIVLGLAALGVRHAVAQQDPFQKSACEDEFVKLRTDLEKRGIALKAAGEKKAAAPEFCRLLRNLTGTEVQMIKFLTEKKSACGIPDQVIKQATDSHTKSVAMREQVCKAAAGPPPPPPSQGLSGALGTSAFGAPPPEAGGGSGVFDTLTGNVLRQ